MKTLYLEELCTDKELDTIKGEYLDSEWINTIIDEDCDIYNKKGEFILSFRKRAIKNTKIGWQNYKHFALPARGRGHSAGPIDPESTYWKKRTLYDTNGVRTSYLKKDGTPSKMKVNNQVFSSPIGYFDETKGLGVNLPCRLTQFTEKHLKEFEGGLPFIQELARHYKRLNPKAYQQQSDRANLQPKYKIPKTPFSTFTINRNFRTALHKDKGDFGGVAVLSVLEHGKYSGGLFTIAKYGIGVNLREGDILVADVHQYHSNTEYFTTPEQDIYNSKLEQVYKYNREVGTLGIEYDWSRISFVCYLREKLVNCNNK